MDEDGISEGNCLEVDQNHLCQLTLLDFNVIEILGNILVTDVVIINFLEFSGRAEGETSSF